MHAEQRDRRQYAVLWAATGRFDPHGNPAVAAPVEIKVKWNWTRSEATDPQGNNVTLDASVLVGQDVPIGSRMWLGRLAAWYGTGSGDVDSELMYVRTSSSQEDLKGRITARNVGLMRMRAGG